MSKFDDCGLIVAMEDVSEFSFWFGSSFEALCFLTFRQTGVKRKLLIVSFQPQQSSSPWPTLVPIAT